jgi:L-ascorbate metabolism protein UlaG (beta-lactamase superfamily)
MNYIYKITIIFLFLGFFSFSSATAKENVMETSSDSLKYIRDSFVKIKTLEGKVIYIDPYAANEFADSADIVLITHEHYDHNDLTRVKRKVTCQIIRSANALLDGVYQSFTIGNIKITAVPAYNGYHPRNQCVGYVIEFDGIKLYHAGDTGKIAEMADLTSQNITYALLPVDGVYTMTPEVATAAAAVIQAKHDIPIHTSPGSAPYDETTAARFTSPNKMSLRPDSTIVLENSPTSVENIYECHQMLSLDQNYPNPFNPTTSISFTLQLKSFVTLKIYDLLGREVVTVVSEYLSAGNHTKQWKAFNIPSGIYFYKLEAGSFIKTKKLILIK